MPKYTNKVFLHICYGEFGICGTLAPSDVLAILLSIPCASSSTSSSFSSPKEEDLLGVYPYSNPPYRDESTHHFGVSHDDSVPTDTLKPRISLWTTMGSILYVTHRQPL